LSISVIVYSPDPPLERDLLVRTCSNAGLPDHLRWEIAFVGDDGALRPVQEGAMTSETIFGWRQDKNAAAVRAAIEGGDRAAVDAFYADDLVAAVWVDVRTRADASWDDEELEEAASVASEAHRKEISSAATMYVVETSARRNDVSLDFQNLIWRSIGVLSNGLMEDPQEGEYASTRELQAEEEAAQPGSVRPRGISGSTVVNAAIVLMMILDLLNAVYSTNGIGLTTIVRHAFTLGMLAACWYLVRTGDSDGWWLLLILAVGMSGLNLWHLPGAAADRKVLLIARAIGYAAAAALLLLPSARRAGGVR
jgi:hypothetical protein